MPRETCRTFQTVGLDYTGALKTREHDKVYILLFTCATSRAVHLELCDNMSCEEFMLAFRRFCARRSFPQLVLSDNAPTFTQASRYLKDLSDNPTVVAFLGDKVQMEVHPSEGTLVWWNVGTVCRYSQIRT